ncbi:hypothetical protein [Embleya sp. NBC_00896]|uniref:hypothetical protein n=1 Tax=Embleya sp. NBC_00896 TaxID=2975961 RepID=UPI002F91B24D|nr:hypothetical protein OG928_38270 [Embleya sp. NBC_00896]
MNDNDEPRQWPPPASAGQGYPEQQLARVFHTAVTHEDAVTRARAEKHVRRWRQVVDRMRDGALRIGSRKPMDEFPVWVTPEVVRGGFATGNASAGGELLPHEVELARRVGVPAERQALFAYHLTEAGLAELTAMLERGDYEVVVPEEAALLVVAWLVAAGDRVGALELLDVLRPFADQLRFAPRPARARSADSSTAYRHTVGQVGEAVAKRRPKPAIEAMHEALTVWNPFADELLALWLDTTDIESGRVLARPPGPDWIARGGELLARYKLLASEHKLCGKHRKPKENQAILRTALAQTVAGRPLDARRRGLLQHAVDAMVRRRGLPGSARHGEIRGRQAQIAALPTHHALAGVVVRRLADLPQHSGTPDVDALVVPVTEEEYARTGVTLGAEIPAAIRHLVEGALSAPIGTLIERGIVPSAEVLAELVPQLVASTTAQAYLDEGLRTLMAAHYQAFRNRRSLLLLNLEHQVRPAELPWVAAVAEYRESSAESQDNARAVLVRLGELALQGFPATILPNPLIGELSALSRGAGLDLPWVEELAADIFMGRFSGKFLAAARLAADVLEGSLYERYFDIDYAEIAVLVGDAVNWRAFGSDRTARFGELCQSRAGNHGGWSPAANGTVIEQAQILTTHNLAALAGPIGVAPVWADLARRCFTTACRLTARVEGNPRPLSTIKDAAYAWRQMLFHLSMCSASERAAVLAWLDDETARHPGHVAARLSPALIGLRAVAAGDRFDARGTVAGGSGLRLLGWSTDRHWMRGPRVG